MAVERNESLEELMRRMVHRVNRNRTSNGNNNWSTSNSVQFQTEPCWRVKSTVLASSRSTFKCRKYQSCSGCCCWIQSKQQLQLHRWTLLTTIQTTDSQGNRHQQHMLAIQKGVRANNWHRFLPWRKWSFYDIVRQWQFQNFITNLRFTSLGCCTDMEWIRGETIPFFIVLGVKKGWR